MSETQQIVEPEYNYEDMWAEYREEERKHEEKLARQRKRLFKAVKQVKGKYFLTALRKVFKGIDDDQYGHPALFELVKAIGKSAGKQKCDYLPIRDEWVEQWSVGDSGDSFAGYVYIQLKEKLFLKIHYSC